MPRETSTATTTARLVSFLLCIAYYLWLSTIFVPIRAAAHDSWLSFAKTWGIRLAISTVFLLLTRRLLLSGSVSSDRITPTPPELPVENALTIGLEDEAFDREIRTEALRSKGRLTLSTFAVVSAISFFMRAHTFWPLRISPHELGLLISAAFDSACTGLIAAYVVSAIANWNNPAANPVTALAKRWRIGVLAFFVLSAAAYWLAKTPWWARQPWTDSLADDAVGGLCILLCAIFFIVLWLPKPADQPEVLHIVPPDPPFSNGR